MKSLVLRSAITLVAGCAPLLGDIVYNFDDTTSSSTVIASGAPGNGGGFSQRSWGEYDRIATLSAGWSASCSTASGSAALASCGVLSFVGSTPSTDTSFGFDGHTGILLNEAPGSVNSISRTINGLTAGQTYTLSFEYWGDNNPLPAGSSYPFSVIVNGNATPYSGIDIGPPPDGTFNTASFTFVANGDNSDTLQFVETTPEGATSEASPIFDNISVTANINHDGPDTPEPATMGLMASALAGLGFLARRRKNQPTQV